jgi:hypothetical protein
MVFILDAIDNSVKAGKPAYVHCRGGVGRTGMVIGCWLLRHGLAEPSDVMDVLMRLRKQDRERGDRMSPETTEQRTFVRQWRDMDGSPSSGGMWWAIFNRIRGRWGQKVDSVWTVEAGRLGWRSS